MQKIADLRHRITLQSKTTTRDDEGIETVIWTDTVTVWAAFETLSGREYFAAAAVNAENTVRLRIRYRANVDSGMRVKLDDRVLDIESAADLDEKHQWIRLMCKEVVTGG